MMELPAEDFPGPFARALAGRYRIERELGRGGMARVFLAEDRKHGRRVALKVMLPEVAAAIGQDRFLREIEIAARLTHPHIVPLHDSGAVEGQLFYVMPYVEGESLRERLDRENRLPLEDVLRLGREIASALGYAHQQGLVHRDIKPGNVLLAEGIALVADFGIARVLGRVGEAEAETAAITALGTTVGTPLYMAPEQAGGDPVDGRADLYALGCVLFEMLAGRPPFLGPDTRSVLEQHRHAEPPDLATLRPGLPGGVAEAVRRALAKLPVDRPATAARLVEALTRGAGAETPTPVQEDPATAPSNLPHQRTRFIGREKELAEGARLLGETQLLTLTGIGGSGKTRLALRMGEDLRNSFPDGVWFVDLAPVSDPERVPLTAARAMGVQEARDRPVKRSLEEHVADRRLLLILDNCEHLLGEAADLAESLLAAGPGMKIIATSREILGVPGERPFGVRSLSLPAREDVDPEVVGASEAVGLFLDRARVIDPDFRLDERNAAVVGEIVRRLDGIPLALELAAARVKILSVDQIRDKLDDRFRLLKGGSRALPRHQTLRAAIEWSHDSLDSDEQTLFRRLAVFGGGWNLEAATAVADADADEFEVMDLLSRLVDKSLVITERHASDMTRYGMLETVRQFAQEKLEAADEAETARRRHLGYYLDLVEDAAPIVAGKGQVAWLGAVEQDLENVLLAHEGTTGDEAEEDLRLLKPLRIFLDSRALYHLGHRLMSEGKDRPGADRFPELRMWVLHAHGIMAYRLARYPEAEVSLREALALGEDGSDPDLLGSTLNWLAHVEVALGKLEEAREHLVRGVAVAREGAGGFTLSTCLNGLAELMRFEGDLEGALPLYEETVAVARREGNRRGVAVNASNLGRTWIGLGEPGKAVPILREGLAMARELGLRPVVSSFLDVVAGLHEAAGDAEAAVRALGLSEGIDKRAGSPREPVDERFVVPLRERLLATLGRERYEALHGPGFNGTFEEGLEEVERALARYSDSASFPGRRSGPDPVEEP